MAYDNTNTGVLFNNDKKGNEKAPDYKGSINIKGEDLQIAAWIRVSKDGNSKYLSLRVSEPFNKQANIEKHNHQASSVVDIDNLPF